MHVFNFGVNNVLKKTLADKLHSSSRVNNFPHGAFTLKEIESNISQSSVLGKLNSLFTLSNDKKTNEKNHFRVRSMWMDPN